MLPFFKPRHILSFITHSAAGYFITNKYAKGHYDFLAQESYQEGEAKGLAAADSNGACPTQYQEYEGAPSHVIAGAALITFLTLSIVTDFIYKAIKTERYINFLYAMASLVVGTMLLHYFIAYYLDSDNFANGYAAGRCIPKACPSDVFIECVSECFNFCQNSYHYKPDVNIRLLNAYTGLSVLATGFSLLLNSLVPLYEKAQMIQQPLNQHRPVLNHGGS